MMVPHPIGVFIIYAREDERYRDELVKHLRPMERDGMVWTWTDRELIAGDVWEPKIKEKLRTADIILLLISADYFNSDYIHEVEIKEALIRHKSGEARIIPIIVRPCDWKIDRIVSQIHALPSDGVSVGEWPNNEAAWVDVVKGIRYIIQEAEIEKANKERERREQIERERLALQEAERKKREAHARKEREKRNKIEQERLAAEKEKLREEAWKSLLNFPTIKTYLDYIKSYPEHSFQEELDHYPTLSIVYKAVLLQIDSEAIEEKLVPFWHVTWLGGLLLWASHDNKEVWEYVGILTLPYLYFVMKAFDFGSKRLEYYIQVRALRLDYKRKTGASL